MRLDLTDEEVVARRELNNIIENDGYPLSPRIGLLRAMRAKLLGVPPEPPLARRQTPDERRPGRTPRVSWSRR
jgi:hypothetical protein